MNYLTIFILQFILLVFILAVIHIIKQLRYYTGRELVLNTFCYLQGIRPLWIRDPVLAQRVLTISDSKGQLIEQLLSSEAWLPILSLESVDGNQWLRMKKSFQILHTYLPPVDKLTEITSQLTDEYLRAHKSIDSRIVVRLTLASMTKWLFDKDFLPEWEFVCQATWEWRKELAIKGKADKALKDRTIQWIQSLIRNSDKYYPIFGENWSEPEYYSLFLQPFFISPAININDIAVTMASPLYLERLERIGRPLPDAISRSKCPSALNDHIVEAINMNHPFPVLERWLPHGLKGSHGNEQVIIKPRTQVFIPMDEMGDCAEFGKNGYWMAFGGGKRACGGREVALAFCSAFFSKALGHPKFRPKDGHQFSGRDNDMSQGWSEVYFQICKTLSVIRRLVRQKRLKV